MKLYKTLAAALLLAFSSSVSSAEKIPVMIAHEGDVTVRLFEDSCTNPKMKAHIEKKDMKRFHKGNAQDSKNYVELCWALSNDKSMVVMVTERDKVFAVPAELFKPEESI